MSLKETLSANNERLRAIKPKAEELAAKTRTEEKTVTLDLADGDQVVTPSSGKFLGKVTITKPDTLLSENILNGVTIAGVAGKVFQVATGTVTGTKGNNFQDYPITVTGLGFKPKYVCIRYADGTTYLSSITSQYYLTMAEGGLHESLILFNGATYPGEYYSNAYKGSMYFDFNDDGFEFYFTRTNIVWGQTYSFIAIG